MDFREKFPLLSKRQKDIYKHIFFMCKKFRTVYISQSRIAEVHGCTREYVNRVLRMFKNWAWIKLVSRGYNTSIYFIADDLKNIDPLDKKNFMNEVDDNTCNNTCDNTENNTDDVTNDTADDDSNTDDNTCNNTDKDTDEVVDEVTPDTSINISINTLTPTPFRVKNRNKGKGKKTIYEKSWEKFFNFVKDHGIKLLPAVIEMIKVAQEVGLNGHTFGLACRHKISYAEFMSILEKVKRDYRNGHINSIAAILDYRLKQRFLCNQR